MLDDDFVVSPDEEEISEEPEIKTPLIYSLEWSDYVLSLLTDGDKKDDNPTCDGLRRIAESLIGPITHKTTQVIQSPKDNNGIATVKVSLHFFVIDSSKIFGTREISTLVEDGVADCGVYNTDHPYCKYQTATAETRAEARALRKVLRLRKVVAAEEIASKEVIDRSTTEKTESSDIEIEETITEEQISLLDTMAYRCDTNVMDLINVGKIKYDDITKVPQSAFFKLVKYLNEIQQKVRVKHHSIGGYVSEWRQTL